LGDAEVPIVNEMSEIIEGGSLPEEILVEMANFVR
jgi:hypothetical protein